MPATLRDVARLAGVSPSTVSRALSTPAVVNAATRARVQAAAAVGGIENARADVRANRAFLRRAVRYLAGDAGIRQFLDIGTGIPNLNDLDPQILWQVTHT